MDHEQSKFRQGLWIFIVASAIAVPLIVTGVILAYTQLTTKQHDDEKIAYVQQCDGRNQDRQDIINFVDGLVVNSERNARATLASPTASSLQKLAATQNLATVQASEAALKTAFAPRDCSYPPVDKLSSTTTTTIVAK